MKKGSPNTCSQDINNLEGPTHTDGQGLEACEPAEGAHKIIACAAAFRGDTFMCYD